MTEQKDSHAQDAGACEHCDFVAWRWRWGEKDFWKYTDLNGPGIPSTAYQVEPLYTDGGSSLRTPAAWECQGRKQALPEPADCNWPDCGCDPHATKVIESLLEQGWCDGTVTRQQYQKEIAQLRAQVEDEKWQPIETAPKDGTHIFLWHPWTLTERIGAPPGFAYVGYWSFGDDGKDQWLDPTDGMAIGEGCTHWKPIGPPHTSTVGASTRPTHYSKLPDGMVCKCPALWRDEDGSHWCCKGKAFVQHTPHVLQPEDKR